MKTKLLIFAFLIFSQFAFSQKKGTVRGTKMDTSCKCSDLVVYPYFYYQDPATPNPSSLLLRFDFHHKGMKCKPEFTGNITSYRSEESKVTIPVANLTSYVDTVGQRILA